GRGEGAWPGGGGAGRGRGARGGEGVARRGPRRARAVRRFGGPAARAGALRGGPGSRTARSQGMSESLLDHIGGPADLRALPREEVARVAEELRREIVERVAKTGGHLASSLGAVELITALHYVFDTPTDRLVFDVG